jgi:hypothetical protein
MRIGFITSLKECWIGIGLLYICTIIFNKKMLFLLKDIKYNIVFN